jgi:hypothetical protein
LILRRIFEHKQKGFYVDVGAYHPFLFSNTYIFYLRGWRGINIDATPGSMKLFNKFRKAVLSIWEKDFFNCIFIHVYLDSFKIFAIYKFNFKE